MSEWQPIETARQSHCDTGEWSEVLVWNTLYDRCDLARIASDGTAWWGDWDVKIPASHWMPLPEPPK